MKKILFIALALTLSTSVFGQNKIKYGITSGVEFLEGGETGFNVGGIGELTFSNNVYANAALLYLNRDFFSGDSGAIVLPVHAGYKLQVADKVRVIGELGPHIGYDFDYLDTRVFGGIGIKLGLDFSNRFRVHVGEDWHFISGGHYRSTVIGLAVFF